MTCTSYNKVPGICHEELAEEVDCRQRFGSTIGVAGGGVARFGQLIEITGWELIPHELRGLTCEITSPISETRRLGDENEEIR